MIEGLFSGRPGRRAARAAGDVESTSPWTGGQPAPDDSRAVNRAYLQRRHATGRTAENATRPDFRPPRRDGNGHMSTYATVASVTNTSAGSGEPQGPGSGGASQPELSQIVDELRLALRDVEQVPGLDPDPGPAPGQQGHPTALARMQASMQITTEKPIDVKPGLLAPGRRVVKLAIRKATRWQVEALAADVREFAQATTETVGETVLGEMGSRMDEMSCALDEARAHADRIEHLTVEIHREIAAALDRLGRLERSTLRPIQSGTPEGARPVPASAAISEHVFDYFAFEGRFRGSREEIAARQRDYLGLFSDVDDIVDVGCGRGEFLALLQAEGKHVRGVDVDADMVDQAAAAGLDVVHGDGVTFLLGLEPGGIGGVCALQVVEHLEPARLMEFLRAAHSVLRPGGVLLLETINPASLSALRNYFADLTHARPIIPETLAFLTESVGFTSPRIELRSPLPETQRLQRVSLGVAAAGAQSVADRNVEILNTLLFAPQDYALIARA